MNKTQYLPAVSAVVPEYDKKSFTVYFRDDKHPLQLNFANYIMWLAIRDDKLAKYLVKNHEDNTFSDMIRDLYEIGYPIDDKVQGFFDDMQTKISPALLRFVDFLRNGMDDFDIEDLTD